MAFFSFLKKQTPVSTPVAQTRGRPVIAVDGPAASGKGTIARRLAERLNYAYLDTGALYRAVALATLEMEGDPSDIIDVKPALGIVLRNLTPELLSSPSLRTRQVSEASSKVAAIPEVRIALVDYQRAFAMNPPGDVGGAVLDGRDIGTVICPDAAVKLFVTANVDIRAQRRFDEMKRSYSSLTYDDVLADLKERDFRDSTRNIAPTKAASDAQWIDTSAATVEESLGQAVTAVREKFLADT